MVVTNTGLSVPLSANLSRLLGRLLCSVSRRVLFGAPGFWNKGGEDRRGETEVRESAVVRSASVSNIAEVVLQRPSGTM